MYDQVRNPSDDVAVILRIVAHVPKPDILSSVADGGGPCGRVAGENSLIGRVLNVQYRYRRLRQTLWTVRPARANTPLAEERARRTESGQPVLGKVDALDITPNGSSSSIIRVDSQIECPGIGIGSADDEWLGHCTMAPAVRVRYAPERPVGEPLIPRKLQCPIVLQPTLHIRRAILRIEHINSRIGHRAVSLIRNRWIQTVGQRERTPAMSREQHDRIARRQVLGAQLDGPSVGGIADGQLLCLLLVESDKRCPSGIADEYHLLVPGSA